MQKGSSSLLMIIRSIWNICIVYTKKTTPQVKMAEKDKSLLMHFIASAKSAVRQGIDPTKTIIEIRKKGITTVEGVQASLKENSKMVER